MSDSSQSVDLAGGESAAQVAWSIGGHRSGRGSTRTVDIDLADQNESHALTINMVGEGTRVLELGCAGGSSTRLLQQRGCRVTAIEVDPDAAAVARQFTETMVVGDLDIMDIDEALDGQRYDVILAADVLEHLRDPERCLRACLRHLEPGGEVILSIPNIAHADVRLALLDGEFQPRPGGLLGETQLRYFTRQTLTEFLDVCGLIELESKRVTRPIGGTEVALPRARTDELVEEMEAAPEAKTYQFIVRATACDARLHLELLDRQRRALLVEVGELRKELQATADLRSAHLGLVRAVCPELIEDGEPTLEPPKLLARLQQTVEDAALQRDLLMAERSGWDERHREAIENYQNALAAERTSWELTRQGLENEVNRVRLSETFRFGGAVLWPFFFVRRCLEKVRHAWRLSRGGR